MNTIQITIVTLLFGLILNGCSTLAENKLQTPKRAHPELGVRLRVSAPENLPEDLRGERKQILQVIFIKPGRSADLAGLKANDILLSLDGNPVSGVDDSVGILQTHQWGDSVMVTILRDGQIYEIPVDLIQKHSALQVKE